MSNPNLKLGECEACDSTQIKVWFTQPGGMWLCETCRDSHLSAVSQNKTVKQLITEFKHLDETIELKSDVFTSVGPAFVELQAAIEHDETIPTDQKGYVLAQQVKEHIVHLKALLIEQKKAVDETGNKLRMFQVNGQELVGRLDAKYRDHFKEFDIQYAPTVKPTKKPAKTPTPGAAGKFNKTEYRDAATKYGVLEHVHMLRMMTLSDKTLTPESAAKKLAVQMGLVKA